MYDLVVVWAVIGSDFASNKELALFQQTLNRHAGVLVMLKNVGHNGICDLVTDLIRMAVADLFTGDNLTHVLSSLSCITKQAAFAHAHKYAPTKVACSVSGETQNLYLTKWISQKLGRQDKKQTSDSLICFFCSK